jgi:dihydroorotase
MKILIRSAIVVNPGSPLNGETLDILVDKGIITETGRNLPVPDGATVFHHEGAMVSPGWLDVKANFREPGEEVKEGMASGLNAAAAGGFTGVVLMPSTTPAIQNRADVAFLKSRAAGNLVEVFPAGALSVQREGVDITEMFDMKQAGAVAFTDDKRPVADSGLMMRALQYAKSIGSMVISFPSDKGLAGKGQVNEGISSTTAGMKGIPAFAESIMVHRDLNICEYTGGRLHFSTLSTAESVHLVRKAKKAGYPVTAEVAAHHLFFDDTAIMGYDTNFKVSPPLRSKADVASLRKAVADGTIDCICSDHNPQDDESKVVEFDFASYGIAGIETAFAAARTACADTVPVEQLIMAFSSNARKVFGLPVPMIRKGEPANLTIFDPSLKWTLSAESMKSKGRNNPFIGMELTGKPLAVCNNAIFKMCADKEEVSSLP